MTPDDEKRFEPELGQMCFGNPTGQHECPEYITALLNHLADEIVRVEGNKGNKIEPLTSNVGGEYIVDMFEMRSYYWGDDEGIAALPNFKYGDIEVRWYKHSGRGASINHPISESGAVLIFDNCLAFLRQREAREMEAKYNDT